MDKTHEVIEQAERWLDDAQMNLRMIRRGKHFDNDLRLKGVVRDLRDLADKLEPHIAVLEENTVLDAFSNEGETHDY